MDSLSADLESFFSSIHMDSTEEYDGTIKSVAKVLNRHYYGSDSEVDHMLVVGSVGRGTAVSGTSDLDLLYELPIPSTPVSTRTRTMVSLLSCKPSKRCSSADGPRQT